MMSQIYYFFAYYLAMAIFALGSLLINIICFFYLLLPYSKKTKSTCRRWIHKSYKLLVNVCNALGLLEVSQTGIDKLSNSNKGVIIANHTGLLDAIVLLAMLPDVNCIFNHKLMGNPLFSHTAQVAGYLANRKGRINDLRNSIRNVTEGNLLLIFPEGTRTDILPLNPFKAGFAYIAYKSGAPIYTVIIRNTGRAFAKNTNILLPCKLPIKYSFQSGEKFLISSYNQLQSEVEEIEQYFRKNLI